jgi:hypothetical protein
VYEPTPSILLGLGSFFAFAPPEPVPSGLPGAFFFGAASSSLFSSSFFCSSCPGPALFSPSLALVFLVRLLVVHVFALRILRDRSISFFLLVFALLATGAVRGLLLGIELAGPLNNVVAGLPDVYGRVVERGVLDGVAALRFDGYLSWAFGLVYLATKCAAALVPRDCQNCISIVQL